jgi:hypothetical protein
LSRSKFVNGSLHACQQSFRRQGADAGALERLNVFPLPRNLLPHALDLGADLLEVSLPIPFCRCCPN